MRTIRFSTLLFSFLLFFAASASAATYTVTKTDDTNDGVCDADCSLREAVGAANATSDDDVIVFSSLFDTPQTIVLSGGEIVIAANGTLTITGPGSDKLAIDGNQASRILSSSANAVITLQNMKFTHGNGAGALNTGRGGAIYNVGGTMIIANCVIDANTAANGGGLNNASSSSPSVPAEMTIYNSVVSNNTSSGSGGGMQNFSTSTITITNSLFVGNTSNGTTGGGGGQFNGRLLITNSTFANNSAPSGSGGGFQSNGSLGAVITNVTVSNNSSLNNGGGIHRGTTNASFFIRNSIVAGNNGNAASPDITNSTGGLLSEGNNIIGVQGTSTGWISSDILGVDPLLSSLGDHGGPTQTFLPGAGSPAIEGGQNCVLDASCTTNNAPINVTVDQRGVSRPFGDFVDIGAVEVNVAQTTATITGRVVTSDGRPISGARILERPASLTSLGTPYVQVAVSNPFGYFRIEGVTTGEAYSFLAVAKQFTFLPQSVTVNGDITDLVLTADPNFSVAGGR